MTKNPFINALSALAYIAVIASFMFYAPQLMGHKDTLLVPIAMLSLFVLSAATMGFLFFYQPLFLYLDGKKEESVTLFLQTVAVFACGTLLFLLVLFFSPSASSETERATSVEQYITQNISTLSPEKEQLGGTFYVTAIQARGETGTVSYEDGHNAYVADFTYETDAELSAVKITSFTIRK